MGQSEIKEVKKGLGVVLFIVAIAIGFIWFTGHCGDFNVCGKMPVDTAKITVDTNKVVVDSSLVQLDSIK